MKRLIVILLSLTAFLAAFGWGAYYMTHSVDWARVYYKRFKAADKYVFDEIAPRFKKTDPAKLIRIESRGTADQIRQDIIEVIWGPEGLPTQKMEPIVIGVPDPLTNLPGIASINTFRVPLDLGYSAYIYVMKPTKPNGKLAIYQHGYAGTVEAMAHLFEALIGQGYTVATTNYPEYGPNQFPYQHLPRFGWYNMSHDRFVAIHPRPISFYIEPVIAIINEMNKDGAYERINMLGFSAGGWIATIAAAVDPRINGTFTVSGGYPIYLRLDNFERQSPPPQYFQPLLMAANYLEMYVLAADGDTRTLTQIFNRYDRCCYRNTYGRLYEPAVRDSAAILGAGQFGVLIDETHADHKVSEWAVERIVEGLAKAALQTKK